jgi:hypothetical protein
MVVAKAIDLRVKAAFFEGRGFRAELGSRSMAVIDRDGAFMKAVLEQLLERKLEPVALADRVDVICRTRNIGEVVLEVKAAVGLVAGRLELADEFVVGGVAVDRHERVYVIIKRVVEDSGRGHRDALTPAPVHFASDG